MVIAITITNEQIIKNIFSLFNVTHSFIVIMAIFYQILHILSILKAVVKTTAFC